MMDLLIVDACNVINSVDRYRRLKQSDRQWASDRLVRELVNLSGSEELEIILVFDGGPEGSEKSIGRLRIIYSGSGAADSIIERIVFESSSEKEVAVCTADWAQQKVVGRRHVKRMAPRELSELIAESLQETRDSQPVKKRNRLEDRLPESIRRQLEKMRLDL